MESSVVKQTIMQKIKEYFVFMKFRLSALVVVSALASYLFVGGSDSTIILYLLVGGMLVTAASNGTNQIWERELDKLMKRTQNRPLPQGLMSVNEGFAVVAICLISGTALLYMINLYSALLGLLAYFFICICIYAIKKKNTLGGICGRHTRGYTTFIGCDSSHRRVWIDSWNLIFCSVYMAVSSFLGNCLGDV